ncbi:DUF2125 domain-containing protein [Sulfitobacter guttiformis]|uniref:DUF2125 domain-containing protein n=1 Tax=Sulfitobacter guttiformis TaxID=74349 RepID=A0A420DQ04_9RHOB|nr:DUF2125 domain-containing protein [Sulfitobacter guttiformis]KIN73730.1 hypothetical protein Z949_2922 [Sulfitobacter guttiformis KCTC 32187]RKE96366.1 hypothetical protein C8N30_0924 [Sulfitobacter guttiformis]
MSRLTVKLLALAVLIWTTWWVLATNGMQRTLNTWFDARQNEGWQASAAQMSRGGFPLRIATTLRDVSLDDPATQSSLQLPEITISTPIYWPGHATVRLPAEPVTLTTPQGILTLTTGGAEAALRLRPGTSLQLEGMRAQSKDIALDLTEGRVAVMQTLDAVIQQGADPQTYDVDLNATGFAPGSIIREGLRLPAAWPDVFETLLADMTIAFDRPWDRSALEDSRPQPRSVKVDQLEARWADLSLSLTANVVVAQGGAMTGTLKLRAENWQRMLDLAAASGAVPLQMRPQIESGLNLLSNLSGSRETLDLDITLEDGRMRMGFIPLGTAPLLILR